MTAEEQLIIAQHFSDNFLLKKKVVKVVDLGTPAAIRLEFKDGTNRLVNGLIAHRIQQPFKRG